MSALPRDRVGVRDASLLVRPAPASRAVVGELHWPLFREGDGVTLACTDQGCVLRHDVAGASRSWRLPVMLDRDAAGLTHIVASGDADGLGRVQIVATFREQPGGHEVLYVRTNALTLLQIAGGRADVPRWSNGAR